MTKTDLQIAYAKALADIGTLNADKAALERELSDAKGHVRKLHIIIGNRYAEKTSTKSGKVVKEPTPEALRWKNALAKAKECGGTAQSYM